MARTNMYTKTKRTAPYKAKPRSSKGGATKVHWSRKVSPAGMRRVFEFSPIGSLTLSPYPPSSQEDDLLQHIMANTELSERIQWSVLARHIPGKTGSHLRWRWNAIRPDRSMRPWTSEEDSYILDFQHEHGNKWLECAKAVSSSGVPGDSTSTIRS